MDLAELKTRLEITGNDQDATLSIALEDAVEFAKFWCNNTFLDDAGQLDIPTPVKKGIALMIEIDRTVTSGVQSESIAGMSQTFTTSDERYAIVFQLWRKFRKARFF